MAAVKPLRQLRWGKVKPEIMSVLVLPVLVYPWQHFGMHSAMFAAGVRPVVSIRTWALPTILWPNGSRFRGLRNDFRRGLIGQQHSRRGLPIFGDPRSICIMEMTPPTEA